MLQGQDIIQEILIHFPEELMKPVNFAISNEPVLKIYARGML